MFKKRAEGGAFQDGKVGEMEVTKQQPTVWLPHHHIPRQGLMIAGFSVAPGRYQFQKGHSLLCRKTWRQSSFNGVS
jgi:hypothetical protein